MKKVTITLSEGQVNDIVTALRTYASVVVRGGKSRSYVDGKQQLLSDYWEQLSINIEEQVQKQ